MIPLQRIQNQTLIRFWDLQVAEPSPVREIKFCDNGLHAQPGQFGVHFDVDGFVGLDTDDEFVAGDIFEDSGRDVFELDADFGFLFVERFAGFHDEGDAVPPFVLDIRD